MSLKQQYNTLWNWLLNKGIIVSALVINFFAAVVLCIALLGLHFFLRWHDKFR